MDSYPPPGRECLEWDRRYAGEELFFGEGSNVYLRARVAALFPTPTRTEADRKAALCLGEGEGRDAVFLAERGFDVTAVDGSIRGLAKLERRAAAAGLEVTVVRADLTDYLPPRRRFDLVTNFYCHLPPDLRRRVHARAAAALVPGGYFLLEGYTPRQLAEGLESGGPRDPSWLFTRRDIRDELGELLDVQQLEELHLDLDNGRHRGEARVLRALARAPVGAERSTRCSNF